MKPEDIKHWIEISIYVGLIVGSLMATGPDGIKPSTKIYYYGFIYMGKVTQWSRRIESLLMDKYFREIQNGSS